MSVGKCYWSGSAVVGHFYWSGSAVVGHFYCNGSAVLGQRVIFTGTGLLLWVRRSFLLEQVCCCRSVSPKIT